jgi:hypothetical protein
MDADELESIMADDLDIEIYEELKQEENIALDPLHGPKPLPRPDSFIERVYKRVLEEFPDYEAEDGPMKQFGWTIGKRRRIRENIKNLKDHDMMPGAVAATCKGLYNVNAKSCELHFKDTLPKEKVWEVLVREWS